MTTSVQNTYNGRLFAGGPRSWLHLARFRWLARTLQELECPCSSVLELGCFDGKAIDWLPEPPLKYLGLDANWEKGLELARERWVEHPNYEFRHCNAPERMQLGGQTFDITICMETLEHVPAAMVAPYLERLAAATTGYALITVPNEMGAVFLAKHAIKCALGSQDTYTTRELIAQTLGQVEAVERAQHKGFSYRHFLGEMRAHFDILCVTGLPFSMLPLELNFGIGILARPLGRQG